MSNALNESSLGDTPSAGNLAIDGRIIANAVLDRAYAKGRAITNLDLQKLVYFMHGHFLLRHHRPLVQGEFEAWSYGPVHRVIYDAFKKYEDSPIGGHAMAFDPITRSLRQLGALRDREALATLDDLLGHYVAMSTYSLVDLTHRPGTPWSRTVEAAESRINIGMKISNAIIREFFEEPAEGYSHKMRD